MRRAIRTGLIGLGIAGTGALAIAAGIVLSADRDAQHRPGHVNCPPGSHGKLWGADHGRMFKDAQRSRRASEAEAGEAVPVSERGLTGPRLSR